MSQPRSMQACESDQPGPGGHQALPVVLRNLRRDLDPVVFPVTAGVWGNQHDGARDPESFVARPCCSLHRSFIDDRCTQGAVLSSGETSDVMMQAILPLNREDRFTDVAPLFQVSHMVAERYLD